MKIPVIKCTQKGTTLYIGKMTIESLLQMGITTEWDPNLGWNLEEQGYQRAPMEKHYKRIATFLINEKDPLLPTCALLSAREEKYGMLNFMPVSKSDADFGYLEIPEDRLLFIVDYQHRWRGFKYAIEEKEHSSLNNFAVPVVIMANAHIYEEIRQFYLINSKQKRVDTDLALALMQTMADAANEIELINLAGPGKRYRIRATRLTFRLAALAKGTWAGRIQEPNMPPKPEQVASPKSFADSLRPILSNRCPLHTLPDDTLLQYIVNYWKGIEILMPKAFAQPANYAIQKTPGLFSMHIVAAKRIFPLCQEFRDFSPKSIAGILSNANEWIKEEFWKTGGEISHWGGASGHKALADKIIERIP